MYQTRMSANNLESILNSQPEDRGNGFYQLMRVDNSEHFLEIRFRDGIKTALAYEKLVWLNYAPEMSMLDLDFMGTMVSVEGRGLVDLFQALKTKKVSWIKEADTDLQDNDSNTIFIKEILVFPPPQDSKE